MNPDRVKTRMKLYDVYMLSRMYLFDGPMLYEAIQQTLERRATPLSTAPAVFAEEFVASKDKQSQRQAFQKRIRVAETVSLSEALNRIRAFLQPVYLAILSKSEWKKHWNHAAERWE